MHKDRCSNSGFDVLLEADHHLAPHIGNPALLRLVGEGAVPKGDRRRPVTPAEISQRISVPTHCGGKVAVRQVIILSSVYPAVAVPGGMKRAGSRTVGHIDSVATRAHDFPQRRA
jgi:hypothetical protein